MMRIAPPDGRGERINVLRQLVAKKAEELRCYGVSGWRTLLIVESNDYVLINRHDVVEEFCTIARTTDVDAFDDVVLVQTGVGPWCVTPLKVSGILQEEAEPTWPNNPGYPFR